MDITYRLLEKETDSSDFEKILSMYLDQESRRPKRTYSLDAITNFCNNSLILFNKLSTDDYVVSAAYDKDSIVSFAVGIKFGALVERQGDILPQWVLNMVYISEKEWKSPRERIHALLVPLTKKMETSGYYSFYKINKVPDNINSKNAGKWLSAYSKTISNKRYVPFVESIIKDNNDWAGLPSVYKRMVYPDIVRPLAIMSHHLIPGLRTYENA